MIIFVKTLSGKTVTLDVKDTDTIASIKVKIEERESVPIAQQRIVFAGKDLDDAKTITECGIKKESIVHLVLKASEKNLSMYTETQKAELEVAQTKVSKYYNMTAGLQDELEQYRDSESKFDGHANPQGEGYDLGKDGEYHEFVILIGTFVPVQMHSPMMALQKKGFIVVLAQDEKAFLAELPRADIAWFLSGTEPGAKGESYPAWTKVSKEDFRTAVIDFHNKGGGLFIWGDNEPLFAHANAVLPDILKEDVQLIGNTPANKTLSIGDGNKTGKFSPHIVFTGVIKLYEGVTISYPNKLGPLRVLATSTDNHPVICFADNEALKSNTVGRVMVDCGYTKNYTSWDSAGSARYIVNATIWLLGLEHKVLHDIPIAGKNKDGSRTPSVRSSPSTSTTTTTQRQQQKQVQQPPPQQQNNNNNNNNNTTTTTTTTSTSSSSSTPKSPSGKSKGWWPFRK